jgi:uncharacterized repeat protein (TIGR01451 family)
MIKINLLPAQSKSRYQLFGRGFSKPLTLIIVLLGIGFLGLIFSVPAVIGTNHISHDVSDGRVCRTDDFCPSAKLSLIDIDVPQAGEYLVELDLHLDDLDEEKDESLYIDFKYNSSHLRPNDPNAGEYLVLADQDGQEFRHNAYAGIFNLPKGKVGLNLYHYANIWDQKPQYKQTNDSPLSESVTLDRIKLTPVHTDRCEMELTKDDNTDSVMPGDLINYTITLTNTGDGMCTGSGVLLEEFYDPETEFISSDTPYFISPKFAGRDLWNFNKVAPGESHEINLTVQVSDTVVDGDVLVNEICVWAAQWGAMDESGSWLCVEEETPVEEPEPVFCELELTKEAFPAVVAPGDDLFYTINLENTGTANCTGGGVELQEFYDGQTSYVSSDPNPFSGEDLWNFGTIEPGEAHTVEIEVLVSPDAQDGDVLTNKVCTWAREFGVKSDEGNWLCVTVDTPVEEENMCVGNSTPQPVINPENPTIVLGDSISFSNESIDVEGDDLEFLWAVNQLGILAPTTDFTFTPPEVGDYIVTLKAADQCSYEVVWTTVTVEEPEICQGNLAPVAVIDPSDQDILIGDIVNFTGSGSSDSEGDSLTYTWLVDDVEVSTDVDYDYTATVTGQFEVSLQVSDECGFDEVTAIVNVAETNECLGHVDPEPAITPANPSITLGNLVIFNSNDSTDSDGDTMNFEWFVDGDFQTTDTVFEYTPTTAGVFTIELKAQDQCGEAIIETTLTVNEPPGDGECQDNTLPIADAGNGAAILVGETVTLDGSGSFDADGDTLTYVWEVPDPARVLSGVTADVSFTDVDPEIKIVTLTVSDECGSSSDTVKISVQNPGGGGSQCTSSAPIAVAGDDISVLPGQVFTLDGTTSTDPENDVLTYRWTIKAINFEEHSATTSLSINQPGLYSAQLVVGDACSSDDDTLLIEVIEEGCVSNCGGGPPVTPPPPPSDPPSNPEPPGEVLGQATFKAPPTSPRAGSKLPLAQAGIGIVSGLITTVGMFTVLRRRQVAVTK